ncbi:MAG TPA: hypothetical protein PLB10_02370 [Thiolinea sp.]|nr:hypothetical protein [Thiolinea sp.]
MKRKSSVCSGFAILLLLLLFPLVSSAKAVCGWAGSPEQAARPVRVLALEYPLGLTLDQWLERVDSRLTCRLFERLYLKPELVLLPYARAFAEMEADNADIDIMLGSDYIFEPQTRCHLKMIPYRYYRVLAYYYATARQAQEPTTLADFAGKRIATLGPRIFSRMTGLDDVEIISALDIEAKFAVLLLGRADYALAMAGEEKRFTGDRIGEISGAVAPGRFFSVATPFAIAATGLVVNVGRPGMQQLAGELEAALEQLRAGSDFGAMVRHDPAYALEQQEPQRSILSLESPGPKGASEDAVICDNRYQPSAGR